MIALNTVSRPSDKSAEEGGDLPPAKATRPGSRRRVLIVNSTLHVGGAERVIACLAGSFDREKYDCRVCWLKENGVVGEEMTREGVEVVGLPGRIPGKVDRLTALKLARLVRQLDIELLHSHDVHSFIDASLVRLWMPRVRHVHTFHFGNYPNREGKFKLVERALWRIPDALVSVGHHQAMTLRTLYRIPEKRLRVLWNGVARPAPRVVEDLQGVRREADVPVIASISTLIGQKGLDHLVRAAGLLRDAGKRFQLLIVGDGHLRASLEAQAAAAGLQDCVRFLGWIPEASDRAMPVCDIFVQSSLWEAMSIVVLEAMAAGKPMVVTSVGENSKVVIHEKTGLLVPPGNAAALAEALGRVLSEPVLRTSLGNAARQRYEDLFTLQQMTARYETLYDELLADRSSQTK